VGPSERRALYSIDATYSFSPNHLYFEASMLLAEVLDARKLLPARPTLPEVEGTRKSLEDLTHHITGRLAPFGVSKDLSLLSQLN
jgi:hypothetical protein